MGSVVVFHRPKWEEGEGLSGREAKGVVEKVVEKLSQNQRKMLEVIAKDPGVSAQKLSELIGISHRKIQDNLSKLKERGVLKRIGPDKGGHWEILQ